MFTSTSEHLSILPYNDRMPSSCQNVGYTGISHKESGMYPLLEVTESQPPIYTTSPNEQLSILPQHHAMLSPASHILDLFVEKHKFRRVCPFFVSQTLLDGEIACLKIFKLCSHYKLVAVILCLTKMKTTD